MNKAFLTTEENNLINFFLFILENHKESFENSEIIENLQIQSSSLKILFRELENLRANYNQFEYNISSKNIKIILSPNFSVNNVYLYFLQSSLNYKLISSLYDDSFESLVSFSNNVNYSIRTIQRSTKNLQSFLSNYNISINFKRKTPLAGEEFLIRYFFERMQWEFFDEDFFMTRINNSPISQEFLSILKINFPKMSNLLYLRILNIFQLSIIRIKKGHKIKHLPKIFYSVSNPIINFHNFYEKVIFPYFIKHHLTNVKTLEKEGYYLYSVLSLISEYSFDSISINNTNQYIIRNEEQTLFYYFLQIFENFIESNLSDKEKKYLEYNFISTYLRFYIFRTNQTVNPVNVNLDSTKNKNITKILAEKIVKICSNKFPHLSNILLDELFILKISFILQNILPNHTPKIQITILSRTGNILFDVVKNQIKQLNGNNLNFTDFNEKTSLIISDYRISKSYYKNNSLLKTLVCSYPLEIKDIQKILLLIEEIQNKKFNSFWDNNLNY